jgi:signal transduction histidine kinase
MAVCAGARASVKSENPQCDSLKNLLKTQSLTKEDQFRIYFEITGHYAGYAPDSVLVYAPLALSVAKGMNGMDAERHLYLHHHMGAAHTFRGNYDSAFVCYDRAMEIAVKAGNRLWEAGTLSLKVFSHAYQGKYISAIDCALKVIAICDDIAEEGNEVNVNTLTNLGELYRRMNNYGMSIYYLDRAAEMCERMEPGGHYEWRVAHVYNEYSATYLERGDMERALAYALKADSVNVHGFVMNRSGTKGLLASIYLQQNDYGRALEAARESLEHADVLKDKSLYLNARKTLSDIYLAQRRYPEAEAEALLAWQADSTHFDESRAVALNLALANIHLHNAEKAERYLKKYSEMNRQYSEKSFHNTVSELAVKYEVEKKEIRISSLERQKILYVSICIIGALLAVAVGLVFRQKIRNERKQKQIIAAHAVMEGEAQERKRLARDLHDGLGGMLSAVKLGIAGDDPRLQHIKEQLDLCIKELRRMAHHLMPLSLSQSGLKVALEDYCLSFPNVRFHFYGEDRRIDEQLELVIYYCAYELVNNSIKHARATLIDVQLILGDDSVLLTVCDDGCGFDKTSSRHGAGLKNISDRVAVFNGKMDTATSPGKGTETNIELKLAVNC